MDPVTYRYALAPTRPIIRLHAIAGRLLGLVFLAFLGVFLGGFLPQILEAPDWREEALTLATIPWGFGERYLVPDPDAWKYWSLRSEIVFQQTAFMGLILLGMFLSRSEWRRLQLELTLTETGLDWHAGDRRGHCPYEAVRAVSLPWLGLGPLRLRTPEGMLTLSPAFQAVGTPRRRYLGWGRHPLLAALRDRLPAGRVRRRPLLSPLLLLAGLLVIGGLAAIPLRESRRLTQMVTAAQGLAQGDVALAQTIGDRLTGEAPEFLPGWLVLSEVHRLRDDLPGALAALDKAQALLPASPNLATRRAQLLLEMGAYRAAVPWLLRIGANVQYRRVALSFLVEEDYDRALFWARQAMRRSRGILHPLLWARLQILRGDRAPAVALMEKLATRQVSPFEALEAAALRRCLGLEARPPGWIFPSPDWAAETWIFRLFTVRQAYFSEGVAAGDALVARWPASRPHSVDVTVAADRLLAARCGSA